MAGPWPGGLGRIARLAGNGVLLGPGLGVDIQDVAVLREAALTSATTPTASPSSRATPRADAAGQRDVDAARCSRTGDASDLPSVSYLAEWHRPTCHTMRKHIWPLLFTAAWAFVVIAAAVAMKRGFELRFLQGVWGDFITIGALTSWLGLTAVFVDPVREWLSRVFGSAVGCGLVVLLLLGAGTTLGVWSCHRVEVEFECTPDNLELWLDNELMDSHACHHHPLWTSADASVSAYASLYQHSRSKLKSLSGFDKAKPVLALEKLDRWSCYLHEGEVDDSEPYLGCGKGSWIRSRTWRVEISPSERSVTDVLNSTPPRLQVSFSPSDPELPRRAIALHGKSDDCYAEGDEQKAAGQDGMQLSGCGVFRKSGELDRYEVRLSICASEGTISNEQAARVKLELRERADTPYGLDCTIHRSR